MGLVLGVSISAFLSLGSVIDGDNQPNQKLPLSTEECRGFNSTDPIMDDGLYWKDKEYGFLTNIFAISYLWISAIGSSSTFVFGAFFSLFFRNEPNSLDKKCMSPPLVRFWMKFYPQKFKDILVKHNTNDEKNSRF